MQDYTDLGYGRFDRGLASTTAQRGTLLGKVLGLLAFAFVFTCFGVAIGSRLGPGSYLIGVIGSLVLVFALMALREKSPINLILLYAFATFEGLLIGPLLDAFLAQGMGNIVLNAAAGTAGITAVAGMYGYTTKRDLSGIGGILFVGLIGIIITSLIGLFLHLPALYVIISMAVVAVFSGFIVYDMNRLARTKFATEGDAIMFAVGLYLDMVNIFVALLQLLSIFGGGGGGGRRSDW
ncbi:MAG TPA: Bax inhibitor-1/YccA family protein [Chloroflexota bacterium]|nr:Bax inhibitor-1/YccA family protein [Chloroflexota bacterium]